MASLKKRPIPDVEGAPDINVISGDKVGTWCSARRAEEPEFQVARSLRGGTPAMRQMGTVFLPMTVRERQEALEYRDRLKRTFLHPGYQGGIEDIASKPFQRPVTLTEPEKLDEDLQKLEHDCDRKGTSLTEFAAKTFEAALDRGAAGIFVDHPPALAEGATRKDDIEQDRRPYFQLVKQDDLIDWGWERDASNREVLAFVAIYSEHDRIDDKGDRIKVQRVTYWTAKEWQQWERADPNPNTLSQPYYADVDIDMVANMSQARIAAGQDAYKLTKEGTHPCGKVPYVPVVLCQYGRDPLQSRPCLHALAWKNVEQWQIGSDRRNVLHYCGAPLIVGSGLGPEQVEKPPPVGAGATFLSTSVDMKMGFAEPGGASAAALKEREGELIDQMTALSMAPLMRVSNKTATGVESDDKTATAKAQGWAEKLEWALWNAYQMAQCWTTQSATAELPEEFDVAVFRDFTLRARAVEELQLIMAMPFLSDESKLRESIERGVIITVDDVEAELERAAGEKEAKLESMMAAMPTAPDGDEAGQDGEPPPESGQPPPKNMPPQLGKQPPMRQAAAS